MKTEVTLLDGKTFAALPCPFCASSFICSELYSGDDGEFDAIYCGDCLGSAPATEWNKRSGAGSYLPDGIQEALNSGDGVYRP